MMGKIAFFDMKGEEGTLYIFEKKAGDYELKLTTTFPVSSIKDLPEGIEESYLSLPLSYLNFRTVELPFSDRRRIREVLPFELNNLILNGSDSVVFDNITLGNINGKYKVLAIYIEKIILREILERFKAFNIYPKVITSIELNPLVDNFDIEHLFNPVELDNKKRINIAISEIKGHIINLRRDEFSYTKDTEKIKKSLRLTAILAALLILVFASDLTLRIFSIKREASNIREEIKKTYLSMFPHERSTGAYGPAALIYQLKSHIKELKTKEESLTGVSPLRLLLDLSRVSRSDIAFTEITIDRERVILRGEASSLSDVQQIKGRLAEFLTDVNISDTKSSLQGRTVFTITAKEKRS
ncbi:MAG: hypothetical protein AB1606_03100 [Nitrospirota bacterium]